MFWAMGVTIVKKFSGRYRGLARKQLIHQGAQGKVEKPQGEKPQNEKGKPSDGLALRRPESRVKLSDGVEVAAVIAVAIGRIVGRAAFLADEIDFVVMIGVQIGQFAGR